MQVFWFLLLAAVVLIVVWHVTKAAVDHDRRAAFVKRMRETFGIGGEP